MSAVRRVRVTTIALTLALLAALLAVTPVSPAAAVSPNVVISQVYGGGGNTGATYTHDFIELFNRGSDPVDLTGWSVQYASATGTGNFGANSGQLTELPAVTLQPGQHLLIQEAQGSGGTTPLPTPDVTDATPIAMAAGAGKVAVVNTTASLGCNGGSTPCSPAQLAQIVDLVGYGNANFFEGPAAAPTLSNTTAASRLDGGCQDTDDNSADFTAGAPTPRNTASPLHMCGAGPTILINEVDADTAGTDTQEVVELFDGGVGHTDLSGKVVVFYNGSNDSSYAAFDLDGFSTDSDGYFLLGNSAVTPAPGIVFADNSLQNGADAVALYEGGASSFPNGTAVTTDGLLDAVVYDTNDADDPGLLVLLNTGQPQVNEGAGGNSAGDSNQRCPNGAGGARNTDTFQQWPPTPGAENTCTAPPAMCGDPVTHFIYEIQGSGLTSPVVGSLVEVEAVVVGDFQNNGSPDNGDLNGFHIQEEDADADGDPATSDGIFVFAPGAIDVAVGDQVRVHGSVSEFNGMTEIGAVTAVSICSTGNPLPAAATLELPVDSLDDFEAVEGMGVVVPQGLVIAEYFNFDRFGEIVLTSERHSTPTAIVEPGDPAIDLLAEQTLDRITLDDGRTNQNPDPAIHPNGGVFDLTNRFRGGDTVSNVTGVMDFAFSLYRIQPTEGADYTAANPRPAVPNDVAGTLEVASFNVLNYFLTIDDGSDNCGPDQNQECRGADDAEELERQRAKIIAALAAIDADVVGLIEMENTTGVEPMADIVSGLNDELGAGTYDYVDTGTIGSDAIKVGFIYKPGAVSLVGDYAILDSTVDARFLDDFNRPVLAQTFQDHTTGGVFTAAVNHLKSKGSDCNSVGDPDTGDGQGNCNLTRLAAAEALVDWLADDPTGSGDEDFLIMGDLNSYDHEDPIDAIREGGDDTADTDDDYTDLLLQYIGEEAYTFVFDGKIGYLDHALANTGLASEVTGTTVWHINADEPDILDYDTTFKQDAQDDLYEPNAYRSSDHDPVIVGLAVCDEVAPTIGVEASPDVLWPPNHQYVTVEATVDAADDFDTDPTVELVSVTSNEPDNGVGDGNTVNDIVILDDDTFLLRAERSSQGEGRVYTITYRVVDDCGNEAFGTAEVLVPLHRRGGR